MIKGQEEAMGFGQHSNSDLLRECLTVCFTTTMTFETSYLDSRSFGKTYGRFEQHNGKDIFFFCASY